MAGIPYSSPYRRQPSSAPSRPGDYNSPPSPWPSPDSAPTTTGRPTYYPDNYSSQPLPTGPIVPNYTYPSPTVATTAPMSAADTSPVAAETVPTAAASPPLAALLSIASDIGGGGGMGANGVGGGGGGGRSDVGGGIATVDTSSADLGGLMSAQDSPGRLHSASLAALRSILGDFNFGDTDIENYGIRDRVGVRHGQAIQQAKRNFQLSRTIGRPGEFQRGRAVSERETAGRRQSATQQGAIPSAQVAAAQQAQMAQQLDNLRLALGLRLSSGLY